MLKFKNKYTVVFPGIGKLKGHEVHLHLKDNVKPVQKPQKIPFHLRKQTESKTNESVILLNLCHQGHLRLFFQIVVAHEPYNLAKVQVCVGTRQVYPMIERG